jgi:NAD(P)-dependent dehydrogenase (short-subunit alcohol dehydrogenase family)
VAMELAGAGMQLALADLDDKALEVTTADVRALGVNAIGVVTDVRDASDVQRLADRAYGELGPVRLLHNNAGVGLIEPIISTTTEDWRWVMDVNYFGIVNALGAFLPPMLATEGEKHIVNTGSMSGLHAVPTLAGYNASKYAVVGLTEAMREELADAQIGVSVVCPGVVGTRIQGRSRKLRAQQSRPPGPLPRSLEPGSWDVLRIVSPESVARAVVRGIRDNELYVMTDPQDHALVANRFERILASFARAVFD